MAYRALTILAGLCGLAFGNDPGSAQCRLCADQPDAMARTPVKPISVEIETGIDFSRIGLLRAGQGGTVTLDPAGGRTLSGSLADLGGIAVEGTVTVRGAPRERVRIELPGTVVLTNSDGDTLRLNQFETDVRGQPRIGEDGILRFSFGARLRIDGRSDGDYRGKIPITVDYQ